MPVVYADVADSLSVSDGELSTVILTMPERWKASAIVYLRRCFIGKSELPCRGI
jgi:hypothetical protein